MPKNTKSGGWDAWLPVISGRRTDGVAVSQRGILWLLSHFYRLGLWFKDRRWRQPAQIQRVAIPVISVGNLTTGGTGKTPFVQWLCRDLRQSQLRVALLSRGYGAVGNGPNDEALELELSLPYVPHLQDPDRVKIARIAVEELEAQCLVLDDGFQHRRLARDLDIVLLDATCPFGYGFLLPRGLLREPLAALRRADALVLTRCDQVSAQQVEQLQGHLKSYLKTPATPVAETIHHPVGLIDSRGRRKSLATVADCPVILFAGVGNPEAFFQTVGQLGAQILATRAYPDHHVYQRDDLDELRTWVARQVAERQPGALNDRTDGGSQRPPARPLIVTTRKDLVKLDLLQIGGLDLVALEIELQFQVGEPALRALIHNCLAQRSTEVL
jgi:tetraacyldisaccharide 4'-kinase